MTETAPDTTILKASFLELFPENCQQEWIGARMAAAMAALMVVELDTTYEKVSETLAHRFGRCVIGPEVSGRCGKKSTCNNELIQEIEDPFEARDILTVI
jgi:hypothetical protein